MKDNCMLGGADEPNGITDPHEPSNPGPGQPPEPVIVPQPDIDEPKTPPD